ncbi:protocadherin-like protein [Mercenaria mercenaria]|uniref:protocadherin-like protein n=1 Tax=Mercenaria mercenaria TaxID=6596 RepID=UPI00234ED5C8|nr:protocadherin-like protein [Mercenaria mercenaria]XP_053407783.1 protocadherin-like protein [Mercenaria mercenaria]XP_053407784.1 protocadherin-like protein [Mercenaria mercenaria]XP_053407785.1 protocadherin-like protein [Mercenaria mercenaria]
MQTMYLLWILLHVIVAGPTDPPNWITSASHSVTSSACTTSVTTLSADSGDSSTVLYSLESESPNGGFTVDDDIFGNKILKCVQASITVASYEVVVRATHDGGNGLHADLTLTITFTDVASGPTWTSGTSYSLDKNVCTACDAVATLAATSSDSTSVTYSFVSGSGFSVSGSTLSCTITSLSASSHTVVVRAQNTGDSATTDQTLTVTVTDSSPPAPTWSTGTSHSLNKGDSTACDSVTTLSATSSDCTPVTYSVQSQSPSGGFSVSGSTLSCDLASITASSYTVDVRAANTGDGANSDLILTITVTDTSGSDDSNSNNSNNDWKVAVGVGVAVGIAALAVAGLVAYLVYRWIKKNQPVCTETITMKPKNKNINEKTDDNTSPAEAKTV